MRPCPPIRNRPDDVCADAKATGQMSGGMFTAFAVTAIDCANCEHVFGGQLCVDVPFSALRFASKRSCVIGAATGRAAFRDGIETVFSRRAEEQMSRVAALRVVAVMADTQRAVEIFNEEDVDESVSKPLGARAANSEATVTIRRGARRPRPAVIGVPMVDFGSETFELSGGQ